ncbi:MAG: hypothetical protein LBC19_06350, partial [Tannerella sp.]|nr:hypothetical protein [Tannerella sp.]
MKKIQLKLAAVLLILAGNLISCEDKEIPVEIPFTEYSLSGTHCRWTYYGDNVLIVNSVEELEKYITIYIEDGYYPEIDFS